MIDFRDNNWHASAKANSLQMLSNYRLNGGKRFGLPATHSRSPEIGAEYCISCAVGAIILSSVTHLV